MMNVTFKNIFLSSALVLGSMTATTAFAQEQSPYETISWTDERPASPTSDDGTAYPNDSGTSTNADDRSGADAPVSPTEEEGR